jgi:hypothetical protein
MAQNHRKPETKRSPSTLASLKRPTASHGFKPVAMPALAAAAAVGAWRKSEKREPKQHELPAILRDDWSRD